MRAVSQTGVTAPLALGLYLAVAFLEIGLPVVPHFGSHVIGEGYDPDIFVWSFGWWPHALLHAQNPVVTHAIWAPDGVDLAWATSIPGVALVFAPVTLLAGPVAAYNAAAI